MPSINKEKIRMVLTLIDPSALVSIHVSYESGECRFSWKSDS